MSNSTLDDLGKLVLRLSVGILMLMHGIFKLSHGIGGIEGMLVAKGLPAFFAWGAYVGEVIAPVIVILGLYTRLGGLLLVVQMVVAILLAHMAQLSMVNSMGGWQLELQGLFLFGGLAIALLGAGRFSLGGSGGRWN
ncbi:DoxX family protein [Pusillimonas sp. CC-YST705]|uniref:DoxX family protein n=1 Tax=Mesopusillimonas faecipullorum TaxID=2755040 RepID=A0ABS8CC21_9BURK|nr:DoxX family protein [Mesopusillimonas faecipullorum]MCB5363575.1 DoxX family protein [Mesopusillimonas faecipullorum]